MVATNPAAPSVNRFGQRGDDNPGIVRWIVNAAAWVALAWHTGSALADIVALAAT
jgi:hypothetical protein